MDVHHTWQTVTIKPSKVNGDRIIRVFRDRKPAGRRRFGRPRIDVKIFTAGKLSKLLAWILRKED